VQKCLAPDIPTTAIKASSVSTANSNAAAATLQQQHCSSNYLQSQPVIAIVPFCNWPSDIIHTAPTERQLNIMRLPDFLKAIRTLHLFLWPTHGWLLSNLMTKQHVIDAFS